MGRHAHFYLHDLELSRLPPDETFIDMLKQNCCLSGPHFPSPAIVEALQDYVTHYHKVRRLHLIVVDLWRPWKYNTARAREITDQLWRISHNEDTRRVSPFRPDGPSPPLRCRRFAYGYALDGSECPSQICVRREALSLFGLREDELLPDLHITREGVLRIGLGAHQEHRVNHEARAADRTKVSAEVIQLAAHEVDPEPTKAESEGGTSLPLRWQLMQNSMSSCKLLIAQRARTFMTKRISLGQSTANFRNWSWFLRDGPWRGCLFLYKNAWTTLTEYWLGVAGKFRQHV